MQRTDAPRKAAALPAYTAVGTPGYFQDTEPTGGTEVSAEFLNQIQEELCNVIEAAGLTLDKADDTQLSAAIALGVAALISAAADTGSVSTTHRRAVIAGQGQATGDKAVALACGQAGGFPTIVSGTAAVAAASYGALVSGDYSAMLAAFYGVVSGDHSVLIASAPGGYTLATDDTLAGAAGGALTWAVHSDTGDAEFTGRVEADEVELPVGSNETACILTEAVAGTTADGASISKTESNSKIAADSIVLWSFDFSGTGGYMSQGEALVTSGQVIFRIVNGSGATISAGTWTISYVIINPA